MYDLCTCVSSPFARSPRARSHARTSRDRLNSRVDPPSPPFWSVASSPFRVFTLRLDDFALCTRPINARRLFVFMSVSTPGNVHLAGREGLVRGVERGQSRQGTITFPAAANHFLALHSRFPLPAARDMHAKTQEIPVKAQNMVQKETFVSLGREKPLLCSRLGRKGSAGFSLGDSDVATAQSTAMLMNYLYSGPPVFSAF